MRVRIVCLFLFGAVGCESMRTAVKPPQDAAHPVEAKQPEAPKTPVEVSRTAVPPAPVPAPARAPAEDDSLIQMARCLERGDVRAAALYLGAYVREHPDRPMFRLQLAELCLRGDQPAEAKFQYERFIADAQDGPATLRPYLVTAHIKLMEIAQRRNDHFGELFHRGVGLLQIVKQLDAEKGQDEFREEMLCKALKALQEAKELKPGEPRVRVYLAEVYERTGNRRAADAERAGARASVTSGELTPAERKPLLLGE
jgi:predicted Zn-dependent protease